MGRLAKQLLFGAIYLVILAVLGYGAYDLFTPDATCFDGRQNHGEDGVDCGTVCGMLCGAALEPLDVGEPVKFDAGRGFDSLVELENPNTIFGAARVDWRLVVSDPATGQEVTSRRGFTYANPLETRYLVVSFPGVSFRETGVRFEYDPRQVQWFRGRLPESSVVDFSVMNERLTVSDAAASYTADVRNDSTFDFDEVDVTVILLDASGERVAVGSTIVRTLAAGGVRAFTVSWPFAVAGPPVRAQVHVSTNVFNNANFIRTYGGQETFQGF